MSYEEEETSPRVSEIDPFKRTPQQIRNLGEKIKSQTPKIRYLERITKEFEKEAKIKLDDELPPIEKVQNRSKWISERRKIADRHGIERLRLS